MSFSFFLMLPTPLKIVFVVVGGIFWSGLRVKEAELQVAVPVAEAKQAAVGEIIINVSANGEIIVDKKVITKADLLEKLKRIAAIHKNQAIRIRGDGKVNYQKIVEVVDICQKAGIPNISFATKVKSKQKQPPNKP